MRLYLPCFHPRLKIFTPIKQKKHQPHTPWNLQSRAIQQLLQIEIGPIGNCRCLHVKRRDPISTPISNISPKKHCRLGDGCLAASCLATSFTGYQFHWLPVQLHWLPVSLAARCVTPTEACKGATWPFNMLTNIAGNTKMRAFAHRNDKSRNHHASSGQRIEQDYGHQIISCRDFSEDVT